MLTLWRIFVLSFVFFSATAHAGYFRADLPVSNPSSSVGTHVIVVGFGDEVGTQWLKAAHTQALVFKEKSKGSIRIIGRTETKSISLLEGWGYTNIATSNSKMTGDKVVEQIAKVQKIASIDFIGHNGALYGFALEDYSNRFYVQHANALKPLIKSKLGADAFARLLGCNSGWILAPALANALNIPVNGTFTYADIQSMYQTNEWFYHDAGRFPEGYYEIATNSISFTQPVSCQNAGGCTRLKTVNINYQGTHGNYGGTLPFAKYFCGNLAQTECFRRMAKSTRTLVSVVSPAGIPTKAQYAKIVADQFCPAWKDSSRRAECMTKVQKHITGEKLLSPTFTTVNGSSMVCDFKGCDYEKVCGTGSCVLQSTGGTSTAYVDELNAYKLGYDTWVNQ